MYKTKQCTKSSSAQNQEVYNIKQWQIHNVQYKTLNIDYMEEKYRLTFAIWINRKHCGN